MIYMITLHLHVQDCCQLWQIVKRLLSDFKCRRAYAYIWKSAKRGVTIYEMIMLRSIIVASIPI